MPELAEALSLVALVVATLEYAILIRHREERRDAIRWQMQVQESLVAAGTETRAPIRRWSQGRFRLER